MKIPIWCEEELPRSVKYLGETEWILPKGWHWHHLGGDDTVNDLGDERSKALGGDIWHLFNEISECFIVYTNEWAIIREEDS